MQAIIAYIETKRQQYETHDFFVTLLDDSSLPGETRLAWGPCTAPFIMGYSDLNRRVFRKGDTQSADPLQQMLNAHTFEEDFHWQWMLRDLAVLGADSPMRMSEAIRVLWGEEFTASRMLCLALAAMASSVPLYGLFLMIEAIEAVSITIFKHCQGIKMHDGKECEFFGTRHYLAETHHAIKDPDATEGQLPTLDENQRVEAKEIVDRSFDLFDTWSSALLVFARNHESHDATYARMIRESKAWGRGKHMRRTSDV